MDRDVIIVANSQPLGKALLRGNSMNTIFSEQSRTPGRFSPVVNEPPTTATTLGPNTGLPLPDDGVYAVGTGGSQCPSAVFVMPYAEGDDDSVFWMRLWGWKTTILQDRSSIGWIPYLLAELVCRVGNIQGPPIQSPNAFLIEQERLCDTLGLTAGMADIYAPGRNLAAHALIPLRGAQKIQFDFAQSPHFQVTMNAFWSRF